MRAVAKQDADIAAIDCVTFAQLEAIDPDLVADLRIIAETEETPSLPFITSPDTDEATLKALRDSLRSVVTDPKHRTLMTSLMLEDVQILPADAYDRVSEIEHKAIALGYPALK